MLRNESYTKIIIIFLGKIHQNLLGVVIKD